MGMHKCFNDDYSGPVGTPTMAEQFEKSYYELLKFAKDGLTAYESVVTKYPGPAAKANLMAYKKAIAKAEQSSNAGEE